MALPVRHPRSKSSSGIFLAIRLIASIDGMEAGFFANGFKAGKLLCFVIFSGSRKCRKHNPPSGIPSPTHRTTISNSRRA